MSSANGHAATLPTMQTWLVASGPLGHQMSLPEDRPLTENEAALIHNVSSMRIDMTRRMLDPRRDVREAAGVPRNIPDALAFLRLYQDDGVAGAVVERLPDETFKVPGEVWDGDSSPYGSGSNDEFQPDEGDGDGTDEGNTGGGGGEADLGESAPRGESVSRNSNPEGINQYTRGVKPAHYGGQAWKASQDAATLGTTEAHAKAAALHGAAMTYYGGLRSTPANLDKRNTHARQAMHHRAQAGISTTNAAPVQADDTPFNQAWADLQAMIRTGGSKSYYKGEEYSPFWRLMRDWDVASRVGRYGVLFVGLDDGKRLDEPAAGLEEEGSVGDGFEYEYQTNEGTKPGDDGWDDPARVRDGGWADRGGRKVVFNTSRRTSTGPAFNSAAGQAARNAPYSLTWNAESDGAKSMAESDKPLLYCRVFTEAHAVPVQWERNRRSPRYQQPTMWHVDFGDPLNTGAVTGPSDTARVHWTRILVLKSDARFNSNVLAGVPACWPVYPEIYNLQKYGAAAGEGYWTSGLPLRFLKTPPAIAGARTIVRRQSAKDSWEQMMSSAQDRFGLFENLEPGQLDSNIQDPTPFVDNDLKKIAMALNMPMRKLIGDPQGALASAEEDTGDWDDVIRGRQQKRAIPEQVVPCVDRFVLLGLLPEPQGGEFDCGWPDVSNLSKTEQATVFSTAMTGLKSWTDAGGDAVWAPEDLLVDFFDKTPEEAQAQLERAAEASQQRMQDEMDAQVEQQSRMIDEGLAPDPTEQPPPQPLMVNPGQKMVEHPSQAKPGMRPRTLAQGNPIPNGKGKGAKK